MKDVIVWGAVICQDVLEWPGSEIDEGVCLIIRDGLVDIQQSQDQTNERDRPQDQKYGGRVLFSQKKMFE
ncbi:MAG TPA: hypothetical protein VLG46_15100 [Anaerolineae bacterium]|nr:hypothetical protein [Anaerolineae bacterium]